MQCFGKFYPCAGVLVTQHQWCSELGFHLSALAHVAFYIDRLINPQFFLKQGLDFHLIVYT